DARELAHQVRLLGAERSSAIDRDSIFPVPFLYLPQPARREIKRFIPACFVKPLPRAQQRVKQPVGMIILQIALHALRTKHAAVEWKLFPRLESDHLVLAHLELDSALLAAKAAVSFHQRKRMAGFRFPAAGGRVVQMRPILLSELRNG